MVGLILSESRPCGELIVKPLRYEEAIDVDAVVEVPNKGALSYGSGNGFHEPL